MACGTLPVVEMYGNAVPEDQFAWACTVCHTRPETEAVGVHAPVEDDTRGAAAVGAGRTVVAPGTVPVSAIVHVRTRSCCNGTEAVVLVALLPVRGEDDGIRVAAEVLSAVTDSYEEGEEGLDERNTLWVGAGPSTVQRRNGARHVEWVVAHMVPHVVHAASCFKLRPISFSNVSVVIQSSKWSNQFL